MDFPNFPGSGVNMAIRRKKPLFAGDQMKSACVNETVSNCSTFMEWSIIHRLGHHAGNISFFSSTENRHHFELFLHPLKSPTKMPSLTCQGGTYAQIFLVWSLTQQLKLKPAAQSMWRMSWTGAGQMRIWGRTAAFQRWKRNDN